MKGDEASEPLIPEKEEAVFVNQSRECSSKSHQSPFTARVLITALLFSCVCNLAFVYRFIFSTATTSPPPQAKDQSLYAHLERDVPTPYKDDSLFSPRNRTLSDAAWDAWVVDPGIVALPHEWVKAKMIPRAQAWPWNGDKGVYLLNGYHNIHCLQLIRKSLIEAAEGKPLSGQSGDPETALEHNLHCIESLRQDTLCNADDTPRYSGYSKHPVAGVMQTRMCRSWDKLEAWARDHTACYRDVGRDIKGFPQIEKYKFCPEGYIFSATGSPMAPWDTGSGVHVPGTE